MKRKIREKILAILLIITILATDFFILESHLITYGKNASNETNNPNVQFSVYFKNDNGQNVDSIDRSIKSENLKLYAEITVKNEGYLNEGATIEIEDSNFNIKNNIYSPYVSSINDNKVTLKQISVGEPVEIVLDIGPKIDDKITVDMLSKISIIKLNGSYTASTGGGIQYGREVCINFKADESAIAELETEIITNKIFSINETNKKIVQLLVKSRISDNQYPVEKTTLKVTIPKLNGIQPEEVKVLAIGKLATNGETEISADNIINQNGVLQININNVSDENNEIIWNKNTFDEIIVTFVYPENGNITGFEITTNSEIKLYNSENTYTAEHKEISENEELNSVIMAEPQIVTEEIYKGQLYANINATEKKEIQYNTITKLVITNASITGEIVVHENLDVFETNEKELIANSKYITTEINKEKMLEILGEDGSITVKNGEKNTVINKDSNADESGNIVLKYEDGIAELDITTTNPIKAGVLEIKHTKAITQNDYTRKQLQKVKTIKTQSSITGANVEEKTMEARLEMKETTTKAELEILTTGNLSTTESTNVTFGITLSTDNVKYDLYKNPTIRIQLPSVVENVTPNSLKKQNTDEFKVSSSFEKETKTIVINLEGEQTEYATQLTQAYLELDLNITVSKLATSQQGTITMTYTNDNATQYFEGDESCGIITKEIAIEAPSELIKMFNISSNANTSISQGVTEQITSEDVGENLGLEMILVNNTNSDIKNVKILGKLPTTGNDSNTLKTTLKSITAPNALVYYTENAEATSNIEDSSNKWTTNLSELTNPTLYLIEIGTLSQSSNYGAVATIQIPDTISNEQESYTQYEVIYDSNAKTNITELSRANTLTTDIVSDLQPNITAKVGQDELTDGATVKEGEVIQYTVSVTNNTNRTLENVELKGTVPEGTTTVRPQEEANNYVYMENNYYEELTSETDIYEATTKTISTLLPGETTSITYLVRINTDITTGTEISNKAITTYNGVVTESDELKNILQESNIRVTINSAEDQRYETFAGAEGIYDVYIQNLSNEVMTNVQIKLISDTFSITQVKVEDVKIEEVSNIIDISEIPANDHIKVNFQGTIRNDVSQNIIYVVVTDENGEYRSNEWVEGLPYTNATINLTSSHNNSNIKEGDIVTYNIIVENTGDIDSMISIKDEIPEHLEIQSISINKVIQWQTTDETDEETYLNELPNSRLEIINLEPGEKGYLDITTRVRYIINTDHNKEIKNVAEVYAFGVLKDTSEEITHILKSNLVNEEETKNTITGSAWLDSNENGQFDAAENILGQVNVKLYDVETKAYLAEYVTNSEGEYKFENLENGKYIIVFEYDMQKYEPTTYAAEGVSSVVNSKAQNQEIEINGEMTTIIGSEVIEIKDGMTSIINIGLKEIKSNTEDPSIEEKISISGYAWLDVNKNGMKDEGEVGVQGVKIKVYNTVTNSYVKNESGIIIQETTNVNGNYNFTDVTKGTYILVYDYDKEKYESTTTSTREINVEGQTITVVATDIMDILENISDINIGLNEKYVDDPEEPTPTEPTPTEPTPTEPTPTEPTPTEPTPTEPTPTEPTPTEPTPTEPTPTEPTPTEPTPTEPTPTEPTPTEPTPTEPTPTKPMPTEPSENKETKTISGFVWLELNSNGKKDEEESGVSGVKVMLYNVSTKEYLTAENGRLLEVTTGIDGKYTFENIEKGSYVILFEYDTEKYEIATKDFNIVLKKVIIDGKERTVATTNTMYIDDNISNINIGLKEKLKFDLELNKYIKRIVVQNSKGTKAYDYENKTFAKIEIHRKQIQGSLIVLEYAIKVKNNGEIAGYAKNIVDYVPKGLTFSSELNTDWYFSGDYLHTKSLENVLINPGEEKEIKLILTKTMTNENTGLINNRAEIYQDYNEYGNTDIDSTPNNQVQGEDDMGAVDVIIGTSTGGTIIAYIILLLINVGLICIAIIILIKNNKIENINNRGRRG